MEDNKIPTALHFRCKGLKLVDKVETVGGRAPEVDVVLSTYESGKRHVSCTHTLSVRNLEGAPTNMGEENNISCKKYLPEKPSCCDARKPYEFVMDNCPSCPHANPIKISQEESS